MRRSENLAFSHTESLLSFHVFLLSPLSDNLLVPLELILLVFKLILLISSPVNFFGKLIPQFIDKNILLSHSMFIRSGFLLILRKSSIKLFGFFKVLARSFSDGYPSLFKLHIFLIQFLREHISAMVKHALEELNAIMLVLLFSLERGLTLLTVNNNFLAMIKVLLLILPQVSRIAEMTFDLGLRAVLFHMLIDTIPSYWGFAKFAFDHGLSANLGMGDKIFSFHDIEAVVALNQSFLTRQEMSGSLISVSAF